MEEQQVEITLNLFMNVRFEVFQLLMKLGVELQRRRTDVILVVCDVVLFLTVTTVVCV